jgi:catechol 2,3-dioxygenase-like lactoylglutathione lyase family enzyme
MPLKIESIDHVQVTVPSHLEAEALRFYDNVLGLEPIKKPDSRAKNGGACYRSGSLELHVSPEELGSGNCESKRHGCFVVADLNEAAAELLGQGIDIVPDRQPIPGWVRFYLRVPGGNRIEIAQRIENASERAKIVKEVESAARQ